MNLPSVVILKIIPFLSDVTTAENFSLINKRYTRAFNDVHTNPCYDKDDLLHEIQLFPSITTFNLPSSFLTTLTSSTRSRQTHEQHFTFPQTLTHVSLHLKTTVNIQPLIKSLKPSINIYIYCTKLLFDMYSDYCTIPNLYFLYDTIENNIKFCKELLSPRLIPHHFCKLQPLHFHSYQSSLRALIGKYFPTNLSINLPTTKKFNIQSRAVDLSLLCLSSITFVGTPPCKIMFSIPKTLHHLSITSFHNISLALLSHTPLTHLSVTSNNSLNIEFPLKLKTLELVKDNGLEVLDVHSLSALTNINISSCSLLTKIIISTNVVDLTLSNCTKLCSLYGNCKNLSLNHCTRLSYIEPHPLHLSIKHYKKIKFSLPTSFEILDLSSFPIDLQFNSSKLKEFSVKFKEQHKSYNFPNVSSLTIDSYIFEPNELSKFTAVKSLSLKNCFFDGNSMPTSLRKLTIMGPHQTYTQLEIPTTLNSLKLSDCYLSNIDLSESHLQQLVLQSVLSSTPIYIPTTLTALEKKSSKFVEVLEKKH
ncbi:hypothetical protein QTN25_001314 [Entamoeba marina]